MPLLMAPIASEGASAILIPSGRTNGSDTMVMSKREAADAVEVDSSAIMVSAFASPALDASVWQILSAIAIPVKGSKSVFDTKAPRPETGVYVSGSAWDVSKQ